MQEFYDNNNDFREYVDRYCKNYVEGRSITVKEAFTHEQIRLIAIHYGIGECRS